MAGGTKAFSTWTMSCPTMPMMSNRTFIVTWWQRMKELAAKDRRYILAGVTAPRDEDNEPSLRVLTSTKTSV